MDTVTWDTTCVSATGGGGGNVRSIPCDHPMMIHFFPMERPVVCYRHHSPRPRVTHMKAQFLLFTQTTFRKEDPKLF